MERLFYESKPYFYVGLSLFAFTGPYSSSLMTASGALLMVVALFVSISRLRYRGYLPPMGEPKRERISRA
jgi:hypothetical protein